MTEALRLSSRSGHNCLSTETATDIAMTPCIVSVSVTGRTAGTGFCGAALDGEQGRKRTDAATAAAMRRDRMKWSRRFIACS
jgi:hypothetical protein